MRSTAENKKRTIAVTIHRCQRTTTEIVACHWRWEWRRLHDCRPTTDRLNAWENEHQVKIIRKFVFVLLALVWVIAAAEVAELAKNSVLCPDTVAQRICCMPSQL